MRRQRENRIIELKISWSAALPKQCARSCETRGSRPEEAGLAVADKRDL